MQYENDLCEMADRFYGADLSRKPHIYLIEYDRLFHRLRDKPISLLEIGVQQGISMQIWREYFPKATVVGLDIDEKPTSFPTESRFHFVRGGQDEPKYMDEAIAAGAPFDIIIDDASHLGCYTGRSFSYLFQKALKPGGIYVIEDICTAFLPHGYDDASPYAPAEIGVSGRPKTFPSHQQGMVGLVKQLLDHTMAPTAGATMSPFAIEKMTVLPNIAVFHKRS